MTPPITVCIATFHRPERLAVLLDDLAAQTLKPDQIVVVDNDAKGSARATVEAARRRALPFELIYDIEPVRCIAGTRNRTVALAGGEWLAFVDDDERAPPEWLERLMDAARTHQVDAVLGPVVPQLPAHAPAWMARGHFYDFARLATGTDLPLNMMRFGNALVRAQPLKALEGPFDARYGLTTGEDGDMLLRLVKAGSRVIWCDEAIVNELIEQKRLSFRWLVLRAYSGGQEYAHKAITGRYGPLGLVGRLKLWVDAVAKLLLSAVLALVMLPAGRHRAAHWLIRASGNVGKLTAFLGWRYQEYASLSVAAEPPDPR